jgi:hypothetical protein
MLIACDFADPVGLDRLVSQVAARVASPDSRPGSASSRLNCASASLAAPHARGRNARPIAHRARRGPGITGIDRAKSLAPIRDRKHSVPDRSASLEVCGPCNAHWLRSRCPGRPVSGRSRFGVSSSRRPARILSCTCRPRCFTFALAVFRFQRIHSDEARLADAYRVGALESNPPLARRVTPMGPDASVSAARRSVALTTCVFDRTRR